MSPHKQFCVFGVLFLGAINLCDVAWAQGVFNYPPPPAIDYLKPEQIRPDLYGPNGSDPAPRFRSPNTSSSTPARCLPYAQAAAKFRDEMGSSLMGNSNSQRIFMDMATDYANAMNALATCIKRGY